MRLLFVLKSYPDIDHIVPAIWSCLERGDRAYLVLEQQYDAQADYRLQFLAGYPEFRLLRLPFVPGASRSSRIAAGLLWIPPVWSLILRLLRIDACVVEWGAGVRRGSSSPRGMTARIRHLLRPIRDRIVEAALRLRMPVFALPHGVSTKMGMDYNHKNIRVMAENSGEMPLDDRNCFTAWVFPNEYSRRVVIEFGRMDPAVGQTWGSMRFCPEWMNILRRICPPADLPPANPGRKRVVFFTPKWNNRVDRAATTALIESLAARADVQLIVQEHPRKGVSEIDDVARARLVRRSNVVFANDQHSSSLVRAADVVIDVGSGLAVDAALLSIPMIYPMYLHENRLIFDEIPACILARDSRGVHEAIDQLVAATLPPMPAPLRDRLEREVVFGGRDPYDIPAEYRERMRQQIDLSEARHAATQGVLA